MHDCAFMHNQKKDSNKFKNKKQPELAENQTVWKTDNQGIKEETFILTTRRGGDRQLGREDSWWGGSWRTRCSHIHMWINWEEQLGSETNHTTQGYSAGEIKPQNLWLITPVGVEVAGETPSLRREFVGETHRALECTQTHPPRISTRRAQFARG